MGHSSDPKIALFIDEIFTTSQYPELRDPFGGVLLRLSGWLNIKDYLDGMGEYFGDRLLRTEFDENLLEKTPQAGDMIKQLMPKVCSIAMDWVPCKVDFSVTCLLLQ